MISQPLSRKRALTCIAINLLATPGLGSIFARRYFAGTWQFILGLAGFCLTTGWMLKTIYDSLQGVSFDAAPIENHAAAPNWTWQLGTILFSVSWIWSLVTSISLWNEASATGNRSVTGVITPPPLKLVAEKIPAALASIPNWQKKGETISRTFQFRDFPSAMNFVNAIAGIAEAAWHHPDIDIRWNKVTLALTTHDAGGLTEKDFALAKKFDELSLR